LNKARRVGDFRLASVFGRRQKTKMNSSRLIEEEDVIRRFIRYAKIDTASSEDSGTHPSTEKQKDLGRLLVRELEEIGAADIFYDEEHNYVYASIPATDKLSERPVIGLISHMDTSQEAPGHDVVPVFTYNYDGGDIALGDDGMILSPVKFPELANYIGRTIIHTDGNSLLGADDKAGIAEIMSLAKLLCEDCRKDDPRYIHGKIAIAFTSDEEIGEGVEFFDLERFGADYAYTVDGGGEGGLEYENFNAASAKILIKGVSVHPGDAKGKMINAASLAAQFQAGLYPNERPENTEGYEGFYHLTSINGNIEESELHYIIRDHDKERFEQRKKMITARADEFNCRYGKGTVTIEIKDQYYNMKEVIDPDNMFLIDKASQAMRDNGITPVITPIRGGTDGAMLSFKGLPCPNLYTGGHNYHGRYEYCVAEVMVDMVKVLADLICSLGADNRS